MMRFALLLGLAGSLLTASPAMACRSVESEHHVFLPELPRALEPNAIVLRVVPQPSVTAGHNGLLVNVTDVVKGEWDHETAWIDFGMVTSCTRVHLPAEGAFVVGERREFTHSTIIARQYRQADWRK